MMDRVQAAGSFLVNAPLAEFDDVRKAVSQLVESEELMKKASQVLPSYFESRCAPFPTDKEPSYVLLSEASKLDEGVYACARSGNAYTVDYTRRAITKARELLDGEKAEIGLGDGLRISLEKAMYNYIDEHHDKYGKYAVTKRGNRYHINVHSDRYRADNFWSGTWVAKGELDPVDGGYNMNLETIVSVHYYEDGNVQVNSSAKDAVLISSGDDEKVAEAVVGAFNNFLVKYHTSVSDYFMKMQNSTFKQLRRQLPITKTKIDWDKLQSYRLLMESS